MVLGNGFIFLVCCAWLVFDGIHGHVQILQHGNKSDNVTADGNPRNISVHIGGPNMGSICIDCQNQIQLSTGLQDDLQDLLRFGDPSVHPFFSISQFPNRYPLSVHPPDVALEGLSDPKYQRSTLRPLILSSAIPIEPETTVSETMEPETTLSEESFEPEPEISPPSVPIEQFDPEISGGESSPKLETLVARAPKHNISFVPDDPDLSYDEPVSHST